MPFKSQAQQKFMFANHPAIARRWASKYGTPKNLPAELSAKLPSGQSRDKKGHSKITPKRLPTGNMKKQNVKPTAAAIQRRMQGKKVPYFGKQN